MNFEVHDGEEKETCQKLHLRAKLIDKNRLLATKECSTFIFMIQNKQFR